jgi:hypothetical protein
VIDELKIYDRALSAKEAGQLFALESEQVSDANGRDTARSNGSTGGNLVRNESSSTPMTRKPLRLLGHLVNESPESIIPDISGHTNFVIDLGWMVHGERLIEIARQRRLNVLLGAIKKEDYDVLRRTGFSLVEQHKDVVSGIYLGNPYWQGFSASDLSQIGRELRAVAAHAQMWAMFAPGKLEAEFVPMEVDVLVVDFCLATSPDEVHRKAAEQVPVFQRRANGRPVVLHWSIWARQIPGIVPQVQPGTLTACGEIVESYGLAGMECSYADHSGYIGLHSRPRLVEELRSLAARWEVNNSSGNR